MFLALALAVQFYIPTIQDILQKDIVDCTNSCIANVGYTVDNATSCKLICVAKQKDIEGAVSK